MIAVKLIKEKDLSILTYAIFVSETNWTKFGLSSQIYNIFMNRLLFLSLGIPQEYAASPRNKTSSNEVSENKSIRHYLLA